MPDFRQIIPLLTELHNAGNVKVPGVATTTIPAAEPGDLDLGLVSRILKFYENNKPLFNLLISLRPLIEGLFKRNDTTVVVTPPVIVPPPPPPPPDVIEPPVVVARKIAALGLRYFWINRKNTPWVEGGGRKLLSAEQFRGVISRADPCQAGDRVTFDCTPVDQFGVKFETGDAANVLMKDIEYEVVGGIGELQLQDPDGIGFDPTPTVFVPWEADSGVKPGFQGELGLIARYTDPDTGAEIVGEVPTIRIRPWA